MQHLYGALIGLVAAVKTYPVRFDENPVVRWIAASVAVMSSTGLFLIRRLTFIPKSVASLR